VRYLIGCVLAVVTISALSGCSRSAEEKEALPLMGESPNFTFLDTEGNNFQFRESDGRIRVVSFFFARCPSICPRINSALKEIHATLPADAPVLFVSISVDPENDTPEVLAEYAKKYRESAEEWKFLTGDATTIQSLLSDGFRLASGMLPDEHNTRVVLVDADGQIRGFYQGMDTSHLKRLQEDLLLAVSRN
jgi:protein SCO1/2